MTERSGAAILVFARAPVAGQAKTRLIPALGESDAAYLHAGMVERTLETASAVSAADLQLWCSPDVSHPIFQHCGTAFRVTLHEQPDGDLGERMVLALRQVLETHSRAILIGTDCPALVPLDLAKAMEDLETGSDWVVGPAMDGGYYLIGASQLHPGVFSGIDWGTGRVFTQTTDRFDRFGLRWSKLGARQDLDTPEDLISFPAYPSVIKRGRDIVELVG